MLWRRLKRDSSVMLPVVNASAEAGLGNHSRMLTSQTARRFLNIYGVSNIVLPGTFLRL